MSVVGCYSLNLYCDYPDGHSPHLYSTPWYESINGKFGAMGEYAGRTFAECAKEARSNGWIINEREDRAICPIHSKKNVRLAKLEVTK